MAPKRSRHRPVRPSTIREDHAKPLLQGNLVEGRVQLEVPAGIYDVQVFTSAKVAC